MTAQKPVALATEMEIIVTGQAALGRDDIGVRIAVSNVVDGGIGTALRHVPNLRSAPSVVAILRKRSLTAKSCSSMGA